MLSRGGRSVKGGGGHRTASRPRVEAIMDAVVGR
jgi:hypothetical protein